MQTTILDISITEENKGNKKWQVYEITHKDSNGKNGTKKLLSFNMPDEMKDFLDEAELPKVVDVVSEKNDRGFWDWIEIAEATEVKPPYKPGAGRATPAAGGGGAKKGDWETAEERAKKQVFIVRQSCLAQAIEYAKTTAGANPAEFSVDVILSIADQFAEYVFQGYDGYLLEKAPKIVKRRASSAKMPEEE